MGDDVRVWGLHCKEDLDLVGERMAAVGLGKLGDVKKLEPTVDVLKAAIRSEYPEKKEGAIGLAAGWLYRFVYEAQEHDTVVYREKGTGVINVGVISGSYYYEPGTVYPQRRPVNWKVTGLSPTDFPPDALYELGAWLTWFRIRHHPDVWTMVLSGQPPSKKDAEEQEESEIDADAIDQATKDFVTRRLAERFKGHAFAELTAHLLDLMGYTTVVSPPGKDYGVDIVAHQGRLGLDPPLIKVQVKSAEKSVGSPAVAQLLGHLAANGEAGLFVTLGHYTPDAQKLEREHANLRLINGAELVGLLLSDYDRLDERYRLLFPLRRIWARDYSAEGDADSP